ncbi:bifunctional folylpolyglutamate synthase/dihydrofolate synthase [Jeotgalicoccus nanhaiensis]|uniref:tetrahydrofolate synthase n=1 Tax=Jeotgalicoccus nanhaiensis TaxID=568603 RepID=A0ABR9XWX4_9STAP|nr:folylpolyglutamate synthase/dihydrofolate synthase family protein [Jeotgalicoccus nanhaiensis]MBF0753508.1 bifunctional folylpolyglutamate synthase/dihydrofolate synthase [Jeotgalicoccus nanhaiensis]TFU62664.1 bifunctional folylpolyglutamate synthase/dihydrofolate synthase [Jeotgalicoccus nanhaiensis]
MDYQDSLKWIHERTKFGIKPGVKRMEWMLGELDHPERKITGVHIVGTNGKGSTLSYMRSALNENGYTVGSFTSPYIEVFNERISIDGKPISDEDIALLANLVRPVSERMIEETDLGNATEFEIITMMMFVYFGNVHPVDYVLVEAGLGATHDSTNVFNPVMTLLTSIGLDHIDILGDTLLDITKDKSGVIKENIPLVFNVKDDTCRDYIYKVLDEKNAKGIEFSRDIILTENGEEFSFKYGKFDFDDIKLEMLGRHQQENASIAIAALLEMMERDLVKLDVNKMIQGVEKTFWTGRIERISEDPLIILDGAHNNEAVDALVDTMRSNYGDKKITVLFSAVKGKPLDTMVYKIGMLADTFNVTEFDFFKAEDGEVLFNAIDHPDKHFVKDYVDYVKHFDGDLLLVTGSLYFISEVKKGLREE